MPAHERNHLTPYAAGLEASGSESWARTWDAITRCETGHDPHQVGAQGETGQGQIHPEYHGDLVRSLGYAWHQLVDPLINAIVGYAVYLERATFDPRGGWGAWSYCARQIGALR